MAGITFFCVGIVVNGGCECARKQLRVQRYSGELSVRVGSSVRVIVRQASERAEVTAEIAQHGVKSFVLMQDEEDMLNFLRGAAANWHDAGVMNVVYGKVVLQHCVVEVLSQQV